MTFKLRNIKRWNCDDKLTLSEMFYPLLLLFFLADNCAGFQPESASRLPWMGPKLRLALRQSKRSEESRLGKLFNPDKARKPAVRSNDCESVELDEISNQMERVGDAEGDHLENLGRIAVEGDHLAEMIKTLQQAIETKQKRRETDGRVRILKVCNWYMCY